jgi:hypothetical protein
MGLCFAEDIFGEDIDLWFRLARERKVAYVDELLSCYRQHPSSIMQNDERALLGSIATHTRNLARARDGMSQSEIERYRSRIAQQYVRLGYLYFRQHRRPEARRAYVDSMQMRLVPETMLFLAKTFLPKWLVTSYHEKNK